MIALPGIFPLPQILPPAWTLSYEMCFYLLCFGYVFIRKKIPSTPLILFIAVGIAITIIHPRALFFLAGLMAAYSLKEKILSWRLTKEPLLYLVLFLLSWTLLAQDKDPDGSHAYEWAWSSYIFAVIALMAATLLILGLIREQGLLSKLLSTPLFLWLGSISYSLYLWHPIVMAVVKRGMYFLNIDELCGDFSQLAFFVLALPPSLFVSHLSYVFLEKYATRFMRNKLKHLH